VNKVTIRIVSSSLLAIAVSIGAMTFGCSSDEPAASKKADAGGKTDSGSTPKDDAAPPDLGVPDSGGPDTGSSSAASATATISATGAKMVNGTATFVEATDGVDVTVSITNAPPGQHGMHVHRDGNCGDGGIAAGPHFNPADAGHGLPSSATRHGGDLGNIVIDDAGAGTISLKVSGITVSEGSTSIADRAIIFHANQDDGTAGDGGSGPGNSGGRIGCGVIKKK
jgi:superoxide dismutase, Cu-Zn family